MATNPVDTSCRQVRGFEPQRTGGDRSPALSMQRVVGQLQLLLATRRATRNAVPSTLEVTRRAA